MAMTMMMTTLFMTSCSCKNMSLFVIIKYKDEFFFLSDFLKTLYGYNGWNLCMSSSRVHHSSLQVALVIS